MAPLARAVQREILVSLEIPAILEIRVTLDRLATPEIPAILVRKETQARSEIPVPREAAPAAVLEPMTRAS